MARSRATGRAKKQHPNPKNAKAAIVCSVCGKGDGKYKCPKCRSPFCCVQCSKDHKANHCPATKAIETGHNDDDVVSKQQSNTSLAATNLSGTTINATNTEPQSKYLPAAAFVQASSSSSSSSQPKKKRIRRSNDEDDSDNDEPGWNITEDMKQMIQHSEWLRKELEDGGLRHLIEQIDAASDVEEDDDDDNSNNKRRKNWGRNTNKNGNNDISQRVLTLARTKHSHPKFATFIDRLLLTAGVLTDGGGGGGEANLFENEGEVGRLELVPVPRRGGGDLVTAAAAAAGKEEESSNEEEDSDSGSDSDDSDGSSAEE